MLTIVQQPPPEPQLVTLEPMLLAGVRAAGDDAGGAAHWARFRSWLDSGIETAGEPAPVIAYVPPLPFASQRTVELLVPVTAAPQVDAEDIVVRTLGGRFVLASGDRSEAGALLRAARAFASAHGLAFERGSIEIYRPGDGESVRVEAGVRIHD
jgi:hypothetical protein